MNPILRAILFGCLTVVTYDAIASVASRVAGFYYGRAVVGSLLIYAAVGFFAAEAAEKYRILFAADAGLALGFTDASLGWLVSIIIGPGRPKSSISPYVWSMVCVRVMTKAALVSALGALPAIVK